MKRFRSLRKGLAIFLTATMVVGLMPDVGTVKVFATEAGGSAATEQGYDANGFCTGFKFDEDGNWVKDGDSSTPCTHGDTCKGYQPATLTTGMHEVDGNSETQDKVYEISNAGQLYWFADKVNNENATYNNINAVLTNDITVNMGVLSDGALNTEKESTFRSWTPIGYYISDSDDRPYTGIFDGQGYTIAGLYFSKEVSFVGLFGESNGTIKKVYVTNSYFYGQRLVGGVCGYNAGTIENSNNTDSFVKSSNQNAGGVCGYNDGTITNCNNAGEVQGLRDSQGSSYVGGVCGSNGGLVKNCSNRGNVTATGSDVGGVCGILHGGSLESSYNIGEVQGSSNVGGICGWIYGSDSSIKNCYYEKKESSSIGAIGYGSSGYRIYVEGKTSEQFSNGVVAYLLNSRSGEDSTVWYQNIGNISTSDTAPVLDSSHGIVYASKPCPAICSNTENTVSTESQAHLFGDDNICTVCGKKGDIIDDPTLISDMPKQVDGVYQITTEREFYSFVALVNGRLVGVNQDTSASAVLKKDITVNAKVLKEDGSLVDDTGSLKTWVPIGYSDGARVQTYTGTFDGYKCQY